MKAFRWDPQKNEWLKAHRKVDFELVVLKIAGGDILAIIDRGNKARYPNQRIFVIDIGGYAHVVPFVESESEIFLKTIIPSRKAKRQFMDEGG